MTDRPKYPRRLAIVVSHPIQYYAPWFAHLTANLKARVRVFYLSDSGVTPRMDYGFGQEISWDVDLLSGYEHSFIGNVARDPGTHHFWGLRNPGLVDALLEWRPDAILLFGYRFFSHGRLIASRRLRHIPFLFRGDSHLLAEKLNFLSRAGKRIALRILFRRFSAFLSVGRANAEYFRRHGVSEDKIFFAPHAVDQERFRAEPAQTERDARAWRDELKIPESHRVILFVGKFERKKSPEDLVRAFFAAALPETTLLLVGSGSLEEALRRMAENHPAIRVAPFQNQSAMPRTYAAANVVVLPSAGPGETWGLAIHEALVCGKPVIVSDHVGCHSDLVQAGRNGFIFPAGETDALRKVLVEAMSDPGRLERWGKAGEEIADGFSYREATAGLERALAMILSGVPAS